MLDAPDPAPRAMTLEVALRPVGVRDFATLGAWLAEAGLGAPPRVDGVWRRLLADPRIQVRVAVASRDGTPLGFYRLDLAPDRSAEITLVVSRLQRRRGVGSELLQAALREARARGLSRLVAKVQPDNSVARDFFLGAGFEAAGGAMQPFQCFERLIHRSDDVAPLEVTR